MEALKEKWPILEYADRARSTILSLALDSVLRGQVTLG